ncbi:MAG: ATP-binding cassette domain-containing protein [Flavobacteriales bacterium]
MMTTGILDALVRLFAVFAAGRSAREAMLGRQAASRYLSGRLSYELTETYLKHYDRALSELNVGTPDSSDFVPLAKRRAKLSVRLLLLCHQIQGELTVRDRLIMYARLSELAQAIGTIDEADSFLDAVADALKLDVDDSRKIKALVQANEARDHDELFSIAVSHEEDETLLCCRLSLEDLFLIKDIGDAMLKLNGNALIPGSISPMAQGSVIKDPSGHALFFSDILQRCSSCDRLDHDLDFHAKDIAHFFSYPKEPALRPLSIHAQSGELIGIMGASGSGKSTLLNVLNGSLQPTFGDVLVNGNSIYQSASANGSIGHIAQQDVLISELTVYENLRFSAALSLSQLAEEELVSRVDRTLQRLGLWEIRHLRVGSVLDKTISGGQRKRLNIALELIREPSILFVDEPTSGLSSRDSEHIMDLLKEQTLRGKIVFVVIHQPSSDIFKLFDGLLLLDVGGYPVYQGNPLECLDYVRQLSNQVQSNHSVCTACGTINPEEIFETIEACMVDEYGQLTDERRVSPEEWNDYYNMVNDLESVPPDPSVIPFVHQSPSWWDQFVIFCRRDLHAKRKNRPYVIMNLLQAPVLALVLALFTRFQSGDQGFVYRWSENLPQFLFISVIVALFLGLSFSAEEIFRDRPTLRRERFLQLNWNAYLASKTGVMLGISAIQSGLYAAISTWILEIPNAFFFIFLTLFSLSSFANILGLNLSSAMKSAKTIYIIIPLLIIPQIIFGGAIIRFDRFNPMFTSIDRVPLIGNLMASRWGFESLAVYLTRENESTLPFVELEDQMERAAWRRDFWHQSYTELEDGTLKEREWQNALEELNSWNWDTSGIDDALDARDAYKAVYKHAFSQRDEVRQALSQSVDLKELKDKHHNEALYEWVMQTDRKKRIELSDRGLVQASSFIHQMPQGLQAWNAPYYAPFKQLGPVKMRTSTFNLIVLWAMSAFLYFLIANRWPERWGWGKKLD